MLLCCCAATLGTWRHRETFVKTEAHSDTVRSLDFNPNKQYNLVTCGDDGTVKFWDTRALKSPLLYMASYAPL